MTELAHALLTVGAVGLAGGIAWPVHALLRARRLRYVAAHRPRPIARPVQRSRLVVQP